MTDRTISPFCRPSPHAELQAQCVHDLDDGGKAGVALFAQGFVQPLTGDARVAGQLHHAARTLGRISKIRLKS